MKVVELKKELKSRGLSTAGKKAELEARLAKSDAEFEAIVRKASRAAAKKRKREEEKRAAASKGVDEGTVDKKSSSTPAKKKKKIVEDDGNAAKEGKTTSPGKNKGVASIVDKGETEKRKSAKTEAKTKRKESTTKQQCWDCYF